MKTKEAKTTKVFIIILIMLSLFKVEAANSIFNTSPHDSLTVIVPNIFTPNSDGVNDTWSIVLHDYGVTLLDMQTTVYDRWGIAVFQTTNIREVWLGHTATGRLCDPGSYFYVITYTNSITNQPESLKGFVELVR